MTKSTMAFVATFATLSVVGCANHTALPAYHPVANKPIALVDAPSPTSSEPPSGKLAWLGPSALTVGETRPLQVRFDSTGGPIAHLILRLKGAQVPPVATAAIASPLETSAASTGTVTPTDDGTAIDFGAVNARKSAWLTLNVASDSACYWVFTADVRAGNGDTSDGTLLQSVPFVVTVKPPQAEAVRYHTKWIGDGHEQIEGHPELNRPDPKPVPVAPADNGGG